MTKPSHFRCTDEHSCINCAHREYFPSIITLRCGLHEFNICETVIFMPDFICDDFVLSKTTEGRIHGGSNNQVQR